MVAFALLAALADVTPAHAHDRLWGPEPDPELLPTVERPATHRVRYLFAPSAFLLEEGEGYVAQKQLLITQAEYGVTDWFSLSASAALPGWIPPVSSGLTSSGWLPNMRVGLKFGGEIGDGLHASFGASLTSILSVGRDGVLAITGQFFEPYIPLPALLAPYGHLTWGTPDLNVTAGFTAPLAAIEGGGDRMFVPHFAGYARANDWLGLAYEYWIYDNQVSDERRFQRSDVSDATFHVIGLIARFDLAPFTIDVGSLISPAVVSNNLQVAALPWLEVSWDFGR